jgi:hypothetical protein
VVGGLWKILGLVVSQSRVCIAYLSLADMDMSWTHHGHTLILALSWTLNYSTSTILCPHHLKQVSNKPQWSPTCCSLIHTCIQNDPDTTQKLKICQETRETRETGQACILAASMCPICTHFLPSRLLPFPTACSTFSIHILYFPNAYLLCFLFVVYHSAGSHCKRTAHFLTS